MGFWWWVLIFGGIALAAVALYVVLGLGLWRRAKVLMRELGRLGDTAATLSAAFDQAAPRRGSGHDVEAQRGWRSS